MLQLVIGNKNYSSWSLRPWVLMKALGISFEERLVVFQEGSNWEPFRKFSPAGLVPCLHDPTLIRGSARRGDRARPRRPSSPR